MTCHQDVRAVIHSDEVSRPLSGGQDQGLVPLLLLFRSCPGQVLVHLRSNLPPDPLLFQVQRVQGQVLWSGVPGRTLASTQVRLLGVPDVFFLRRDCAPPPALIWPVGEQDVLEMQDVTHGEMTGMEEVLGIQLQSGKEAVGEKVDACGEKVDSAVSKKYTEDKRGVKNDEKEVSKKVAVSGKEAAEEKVVAHGDQGNGATSKKYTEEKIVVENVKVEVSKKVGVTGRELEKNKVGAGEVNTEKNVKVSSPEVEETSEKCEEVMDNIQLNTTKDVEACIDQVPAKQMNDLSTEDLVKSTQEPVNPIKAVEKTEPVWQPLAYPPPVSSSLIPQVTFCSCS